jgi:hypothetical protein
MLLKQQMMGVHMLNQYLKMKRSGHTRHKIFITQIILIVFIKCVFAINLDSISKLQPKEYTPEESAKIVQKEQERILNEKREIIENIFKQIDSVGYSKEKLQYIIGDSAGLELFKRVKIIRSEYRKKQNGYFNRDAERLDENIITLNTVISTVQSYFWIKNLLLPNKVPSVTGDQLRDYQRNGIYDSASSLYTLFRLNLGIDSSCKAYGPIINKIKKDKIFSFVLKYSSKERFYAYFDELSLDSLLMVFDEVHNFTDREKEILEKWDYERTLEHLFNNLFKYYQQIKNINIEDTKKDEKLKSKYQKLLSLFKNKSTLKMLDYWDVRFKDTMDGTMYPEVREYIKNLHKK